ncbi:MAG: radical SAM protein [Rikenellaceae bacterium]
MSTILFNQIIFGPVKSRRLGTSLGVNLSPQFGKWCSFDCLYCECGFNKDGRKDSKLPRIEEVKENLEAKLKEYTQNVGKIDTITFSGNGEPTMHPQFAEIIDLTLALRAKYTPEAKVSVLSNGSQTGKPKIANALLKVDNAILKIDSAFEETTMLIDRPQYDYSLDKLIENLKPFKGRFVLQTMFLRGEFEGRIIDNTTEKEVVAWRKLTEVMQPREIMIYTIDRDTPAKNLRKVSVVQMQKIAAPLIEKGFKVTISG